MKNLEMPSIVLVLDLRGLWDFISRPVENKQLTLITI